MVKYKLITKIINEAYPMDLLLLADPSETLVKQYLKFGECYVAELNGETIGVYVLLPTRPDTVELVNIAVAEQYHGKGIGKKLVLDAVQKAKQQGYLIMEVGTGNSSIGQLALYQKCGFRITGVDKDFFTIHYEEEIIENGIACVDMIRLAQQL
ncbi:GNAT family N-acetyltransferase [Psychrobacillus vulpis]|uniref:GNAT family N-acetyltransferase n=1 Tax=Psychrobacillus vulpis TaxID=2325572 RepID=A0A544TVX4_9BACI|nr:GNAT family N-acetyltransferase [Psychrobacillus vulpis]TQR21599.1 GNAT family N-acetyltransferase [Psychrobacillus vulpis]